MTIIFQRYNGSEWIDESESGGSGSANHASLTNLAWTNSRHTGDADTYAGFDSEGNATFLGRGVDGGSAASVYLPTQNIDGGNA